MNEKINKDALYDVFVKDHWNICGELDRMYGLAINVLDRFYLDDEQNDETLMDAIDNGLIPTCNRWTLLQYYCTPEEAYYDVAWDDFYNDLKVVISKG